MPGGWRNRYPDDSTHLASARGDADGAEDGARREHRHHVALVDRRAKREPARGTCAYECEPKGTGGGICKYRRAWLRGQASVTHETLQNICSPLLISKPLLVRVLDDRAFRDRPLDASTRTHTHTHTHTPPTTSRHIRAADRATAPRWPSPPRSAARASYRICDETVPVDQEHGRPRRHLRVRHHRRRVHVSHGKIRAQRENPAEVRACEQNTTSMSF